MAERFLYMRGAATRDLESFTSGLTSIIEGTNPSGLWRSEENQSRYIHYRQSLGEEGVTSHIRARMMGHTMALLENDFPYDNLMPLGGESNHAGGELIHYCLWSEDGDLLVPKYINKVIDVNFGDLSSLVFMHGEETKSVKTLEHAHIVLDLQRTKPILAQRFFEVWDFIPERRSQ